MINKLENDKRSLSEELGKSEGRATKMELQRMSLEGDLQRLQMILQEKESTIQVACAKKIYNTRHSLNFYDDFRNWQNEARVRPEPLLAWKSAAFR